MSNEVLELGGHQVNLVAGSGGVFEVTVEGRTLFSKADSNRFPELGEIASLLADE